MNFRKIGRVRRILMLATSGLALGVVGGTAQVATNVGEGGKVFDGSRAVPLHPDQSKELAMKIKKPFTVASVGDLLEFQPFADRNDPDIQYVVNIIRNADIATGDLENEIRDFDNFGHYGGNLATKEVADDFARMGIDMVSRANNKDQGAPGVWEDFREIERVGIVHAGVAHSLPEAQMARYRETPKGLVGFEGVYSAGGTDACCTGGAIVYVTPNQLAQVKAIKDSILARRDEVEVPVDLPPPDAAGTVAVFGLTFKQGTKPAAGTPEAAADEAAGRPRGRGGDGDGGPAKPGDGVMNTIHLTLYHGVTADQMAQLRAIAGDSGTGSDLSAFGTQFRVMAKPGEHSFDMNPQEEKAVLTQIRTGKQASDIMISNFHWHQNRYDFQHYSYDHYPADFEIKFAHEAIDQGDDVFVAQGVHTIKGVEIYKGKPIFYGTSNFAFQNSIMPEGKGKVPGADAAAAPGRGGRGAGPRTSLAATPTSGGPDTNPPPMPADGIVGEHEVQGFWQMKSNMEALLATSHFENGKLTEVRIYPLDLGQTPRVGSDVGIPRKPTPAVAKKILDEVIEYSKPFGTKIAVENGVGVIKLGK